MKKIALIILNDPIRRNFLKKLLASRDYIPISISTTDDLDSPYLQYRFDLVIAESRHAEPVEFRRDLREVLNFGKLLVIGNAFERNQFFPSYQLPGAAGLLL